jgi:hypothetical protein
MTELMKTTSLKNGWVMCFGFELCTLSVVRYLRASRVLADLGPTNKVQSTKYKAQIPDLKLSDQKFFTKSIP